MEFVPYLICFLCGALVSWFVGFAETRLSHHHRIAVGAGRKAATAAVASGVAGYQNTLNEHGRRIHTLESKVLGN